MIIDRDTVGAQGENFLILVRLLKRFLYKPNLHAIDAREKRIAGERDRHSEQRQQTAENWRPEPRPPDFTPLSRAEPFRYGRAKQ